MAARSDADGGVARRLGGVGAARSAIVVLPLVVLPVLAGHVTREEWIAIGIGQSMGALAAVVAGGGWALTGPPEVALGEREARSLFTDALRSTALLFLGVAPVACLIAAVIAPEGARTLAALMTVAGASAGISPAWFLAVRGDIARLLAVDVGPRVVAGLLAAAAVARWGGEAVLWYPGLTLLAGLAGPAWYGAGHVVHPERPVLAVLGRQIVPTLSALVAVGYSAVAVTLVALVAAADDAAEFASGFRLYTVALAATVVVNQSTQHWARAGRGGSREERVVALRLYGVVATSLLAGFVLIGAPVSRLLFGADFAIDRATATALGVACFVLSVESFVTTHLVVPYGRHSELLRATLAGALLGVPLTLFAAQHFGATGAAWTLALSETTVTAVLMHFARGHRRRAISSPGGEPPA